MRQAWDQVDSDPGIRACVLTGAGGAFCAGADLKAMTSDHPGSRLGDFDLSVIEPLLKGRRLTKPLIAAVEGPAIAGGTEILQACDIRVAGRERAVRRLRGALGPVPAGRLRGPAAPADPLHGRRRPAADRAAHQCRGGALDRAHRPRGAGRPGTGQGARDRRADRRERPGRRARDPGRDAGDRGNGRERRVRGRGQARAPRCSPATTRGRARAPSPRSAARGSATPNQGEREVNARAAAGGRGAPGAAALLLISPQAGQGDSPCDFRPVIGGLKSHGERR